MPAVSCASLADGPPRSTPPSGVNAMSNDSSELIPDPQSPPPSVVTGVVGPAPGERSRACAGMRLTLNVLVTGGRRKQTAFFLIAMRPAEKLVQALTRTEAIKVYVPFVRTSKVSLRQNQSRESFSTDTGSRAVQGLRRASRTGFNCRTGWPSGPRSSISYRRSSGGIQIYSVLELVLRTSMSQKRSFSKAPIPLDFLTHTPTQRPLEDAPHVWGGRGCRGCANTAPGEARAVTVMSIRGPRKLECFKLILLFVSRPVALAIADEASGSTP